MFGLDLGFAIFVGVFILVGVGLIVSGLIQLVKTARFVGSSVSATGTVITLVVHHLPMTTKLTKTTTKGFRQKTRKLNPKAPQIRFTTAEGETITFTHNAASDPPTHKIGQEVSVRYHPSRPHEAQLASFGALWFIPIIFVFVGTLVTVFMTFFAMSKMG